MKKAGDMPRPFAFGLDVADQEPAISPIDSSFRMT
jgi:hypothetical protein